MYRIRSSFIAIIIISLLLSSCGFSDVTINDEELPLALYSKHQLHVKEGPQDINVIPDKYNTGISKDTQLEVVTEAGYFDDVYFKYTSNKTKLALDLVYSNKTLGNTIVIEGVDFSSYPLVFMNDNALKSEKKIIFRNCKFLSVTAGRDSSNATYIFENCEIARFYGSNASFDYCKFGGTNSDGLNPLKNVTVTNSFVSDLAHNIDTTGTIHTDGLQIYGHKDIAAENIHFKNVRFEVPDIPYIEEGSVYVNACIVVGLEFSSGDNISFTDCIINGGGYSIYVGANSPYELVNTTFNNVQIGSSHRWGDIYNKTGKNVDFLNLSDTDMLYVSSVWKDDNNNIHLSVSNDTLEDRVLQVVTDNGLKTFLIEGCPSYDDMVGKNYTYSQLPFDIDINLGVDSSYIVCYDSVIDEKKQIRYLNWNDSPVYLQYSPILEDSTLAEEHESSNFMEAKIFSEGKCGRDSTYTLFEDGTLVIDGIGSTYNYSSLWRSPWYSQRNSIKRVVIKEGIEIIGGQSFSNSSILSDVSLPKSLKRINANAFINCRSLEEITISQNLRVIDRFAFHKTGLKNVYFESDVNFEDLTIDVMNDSFLNAITK